MTCVFVCFFVSCQVFHHEDLHLTGNRTTILLAQANVCARGGAPEISDKPLRILGRHNGLWAMEDGPMP